MLNLVWIHNQLRILNHNVHKNIIIYIVTWVLSIDSGFFYILYRYDIAFAAVIEKRGKGVNV